MLRILLFTSGGNYMGLGVPFLLSLLGIFSKIFYHFRIKCISTTYIHFSVLVCTTL